MRKDLVERVARAMWMADPDPYDPSERRPFEEIEETTKREIRAEAIAAISVVLEEAAQVAEAGHAIDFKRDSSEYAAGYWNSCDDIAAAIRDILRAEKNG